MANLSVRKLDDKLYEKLRARAAMHGVSMEQEARQILSLALTTPERFSDVFKKYFGSNGGIDLETLEHCEPHQPMSFEE